MWFSPVKKGNLYIRFSRWKFRGGRPDLGLSAPTCPSHGTLLFLGPPSLLVVGGPVIVGHGVAGEEGLGQLPSPGLV